MIGPTADVLDACCTALYPLFPESATDESKWLPTGILSDLGERQLQCGYEWE